MPIDQFKPDDQARIVAFLAQESQVPVPVVAQIYEKERAALAAAAHITQFLHIFAIRKVQDILQQRRLSALA